MYDVCTNPTDVHVHVHVGDNLIYFISLDTIGLHRVENVSHTDTAVSLHLYSPPITCCQSFDERTGLIT